MGVLAGGVQEGIWSLKTLPQESGHGPRISRRAGEVQSLGANISTEGAGWGWRDRQGLTDSPTYYCRDQSLPPRILVFQEKVTRMFGFNYSFFLSCSCQGGKGKQTAAWGGAAQLLFHSRHAMGACEGGVGRREAGSQSTSQTLAGTAQFFPGSWKGRGLLAP